MTVKELIEQLKQYNPDETVCISVYDPDVDEKISTKLDRVVFVTRDIFEGGKKIKTETELLLETMD